MSEFAKAAKKLYAGYTISAIASIIYILWGVFAPSLFILIVLAVILLIAVIYLIYGYVLLYFAIYDYNKKVKYIGSPSIAISALLFPYIGFFKLDSVLLNVDNRFNNAALLLEYAAGFLIVSLIFMVPLFILTDPFLLIVNYILVLVFIIIGLVFAAFAWKEAYEISVKLGI